MGDKSTLCLECFTENNPLLTQCWRCKAELNPNPEKASNGLILADWNVFFGFVELLGANLCKRLSLEDLVKYDGFHYDCVCGSRLVFYSKNYTSFFSMLWKLPENKIAFPALHISPEERIRGCGMVCVRPSGIWIWRGFDSIFGCKKPVKVTRDGDKQ